jgi:hypothetical protein
MGAGAVPHPRAAKGAGVRSVEGADRIELAEFQLSASRGMRADLALHSLGGHTRAHPGGDKGAGPGGGFGAKERPRDSEGARRRTPGARERRCGGALRARAPPQRELSAHQCSDQQKTAGLGFTAMAGC